jgi:hypothetical protein
LGPLPKPPADFNARTLPLIRRRGPWMRIHALGRDALGFGTSRRNRFDDPRGLFGVLYAAADAHGAFIETAGHATGMNIVSQSWLDSHALSRIVPRRPLVLADVRGPGLARLRLDARLTAGDLSPAQAYSRAFHDHPLHPDGLLYPLRHDPSREGIALFSRARRDVRAVLVGSLSAPAQAGLFARVFDDYGFDLIPT